MTETAPPPPPGHPADDPRPGPGPDRPTAGPFAGSLSGRTLRRSRTDRKVAGVAGGLGRWLDVDPTVLRVLFVVLALFGGAGFLLYAVAWLVVPEEGEAQGRVPTGDSVRNAVLVGALAAALIVAFGGGSVDGHVLGWPVLVVGLVVAALLLGRDGRRQAAGSWGPPQPPPSGSEPTVVLEKQPAWYPPTASYRPAPPPPARRSGPLLLGPALAVIALGLGVLGLYDAVGGHVSSAAYPALALALVGLLLVVGAFVGRPGGLVLLGLVAVVALVVTAVVDPAYSGPRDLRLAPASAAALEDGYHVPTGRVELDLRGMDPASLDGRSLEISVGAGEVVVLVPPSVQVTYDAAIDFSGHIDVDGRVSDGWSPELTGTDAPEGTDRTGGPAELDLQLSADFGQLQVVRS